MPVICPRCLNETSVTVDVNDGELLHCPGCDEGYTVTEVLDLIESWQALIPWLKSHPAKQPEQLARKAAVTTA